MIFTLFYMYSTFMQWWRLGSLRNKISGTLNGKNALMICNSTSISEPRHHRCLENLLFYKDNRMGCTVVPRQKVNLSHWINFPQDLVYFPIYFGYAKLNLASPKMHVLVQAHLENYEPHDAEIIEIERFGELVAWRVSSNLEIILQTDLDNVTKLIHCFSNGELDINHDLKLIRVETVDVEGSACTIKYSKVFPLEQKVKYSCSELHWRKFVEDIKELYSKIYELSLNPKITIENGAKAEDCKKVPVSEVKPIKKETKKDLETNEEEKNMLVVHPRKSDHRLKAEKHRGSGDKVKESKVEVRKSREVHKHKEVNRRFKEEVQVAGDKIGKSREEPEKKAKVGHKLDECGHRTTADVLRANNTSPKMEVFRVTEAKSKDSPSERGKVSVRHKGDKSCRLQSRRSKESILENDAGNSTVTNAKDVVNDVVSKNIPHMLNAHQQSEARANVLSNDEVLSDPSQTSENKSLCAAVTKITTDNLSTAGTTLTNSEELTMKTATSQTSAYSDELDMKTAMSQTSQSVSLDNRKSGDSIFCISEDGAKSMEDVVAPKQSIGRTNLRNDFAPGLVLEDGSNSSFVESLETLSSRCASLRADESQKDGREGPGHKFKVSSIIQERNIAFPDSREDAKKLLKSARIANTKPPNVLVYADSLVAKENVKEVLHSILNKEKYTVYDLPVNKTANFWDDSTTLVVVSGNVTPTLTNNLLQYLLTGGQLLCLCSDLLYSVLQTFSTAEVREHELVRFSYGDWKRVKMMHHIFCYQASPAKKQFSKDSDQSNHSDGSSPIAPRTPSAVEIHHNGESYTIQVQVLGTEETWQTPSLLLACVKGSKGRAIFSQVHLEIDPTQYQDDESKYAALTDSNQARLEILKHILSNHLDIDCTNKAVDITYTPAYFLGRHDMKLQMLTECEAVKNNKLENDKISLVFCGKDVDPGNATPTRLPVLVLACPSNFSTVQYFENLRTQEIGRLVIYADVLTSSHHVLSQRLRHGLVVIPRQQTEGVGRSTNTWLSPLGCAMFSLQMHVPMTSTLGKSLPLIQHLAMVAVVSAIRGTPGYEKIEIGLKWPNDLYAYSKVKIGGLVVASQIFSDVAVVNIGCGVNLDNSNPTTCINDIIKKYNEEHKGELQKIGYETFFAMVFNELERILKIIQNGDIGFLFDLYYQYWLHGNSDISVITKEGETRKVKIIGLDDFGYLTVRSPDGSISGVQPDGNTFDMLKGLIAPKIN